MLNTHMAYPACNLLLSARKQRGSGLREWERERNTKTQTKRELQKGSKPAIKNRNCETFSQRAKNGQLIINWAVQGDNNQRAEKKVFADYIKLYNQQKRQREKYNQNGKWQTQQVQNRQQQQEEMKEYALKRHRKWEIQGCSCQW